MYSDFFLFFQDRTLMILHQDSQEATRQTNLHSSVKYGSGLCDTLSLVLTDALRAPWLPPRIWSAAQAWQGIFQSAYTVTTNPPTERSVYTMTKWTESLSGQVRAHNETFKKKVCGKIGSFN